jgi:pyruvate ferredoxin oxidoreductase beta subunit
MANLKELASREDLLSGGHRACAGCGGTIAIRQILLAANDGTRNIVVGFATGCMEVVTTIYPQTAWKLPYIHNAFENAAATMSGVEAAYIALLRSGKLKKDKPTTFICFGGDGGTYDIGIQSLSGMLERGHDILYVCYNNEAYMNTGVQRSGATPFAAHTTTAPVGEVHLGKRQFPKPLTEIIAAHDIPFVAQSAVGFWRDLTKKTEKAVSIKGPKFINVLPSCVPGWGYDASDSLDIARAAVDTCFWPLYEVDHGKHILSYKPKNKLPVMEYIKLQKRFKHLLNPAHQDVVDKIQTEIDRKWDILLKMCGEV